MGTAVMLEIIFPWEQCLWPMHILICQFISETQYRFEIMIYSPEVHLTKNYPINLFVI